MCRGQAILKFLQFRRNLNCAVGIFWLILMTITIAMFFTLCLGVIWLVIGIQSGYMILIVLYGAYYVGILVAGAITQARVVFKKV